MPRHHAQHSDVGNGCLAISATALGLGPQMPLVLVLKAFLKVRQWPVETQRPPPRPGT